MPTADPLLAQTAATLIREVFTAASTEASIPGSTEDPMGGSMEVSMVVFTGRAMAEVTWATEAILTMERETKLGIELSSTPVAWGILEASFRMILRLFTTAFLVFLAFERIDW